VRACLHHLRLTCWLIVEHLNQFDDALVVAEDIQRLNLFQLLDLFYRVELLFHALDRHVFPRLQGQRHEDYRKGAIALLSLELVLVHCGSGYGRVILFPGGITQLNHSHTIWFDRSDNATTAATTPRTRSMDKWACESVSRQLCA